MSDLNLTAGAVFGQLATTFKVMRGKAKLDEAYIFSQNALWQAIFAGWILATLSSALLVDLQNITPFIVTSLAALIAIVLFVILIIQIFGRVGRSARVLPFLVPFLWVSNFQIVFVGMLLGLILITQATVLQIPALAILIWSMIWLFRIARRQADVSGWWAVGLLLMQMAVDASVRLFANSMAAL